MAQWKCFPRIVMLWTVFTVCAGAGVAGAAQAPAGNPIQVIPADTLFCLRLNKLSATLGQMDQFLTGVSSGVSVPVRAQLGQLLGGPEPNGVNMAGDFAVFGPLPGGEAPNPKRIGLLIPLSDYQKFLTNPNVTKPDAQGISRIGPEGKQSVVAEQVGSFMLLTGMENQGALVEMKKLMTGSGATSLAQRLGPDELKRADDAPVWLYVNMQIVAKTYGPKLQEKLKEAQKNLQEMQAKGQPAMGQPPAALLDAYAAVLNSLMQETQSVSLTLNPSPTVIRAALMAAAVPNTEMAKNLSMENPPAQPNLMGYFQNGAIANFLANINPALLRAISLRYVDMFTTLAGQSASPEDVTKFKQLMMDSADALGGALAFSYLPAPKSKPPFEVIYAATLRDKQKFYRVLEEAPKLMAQGLLADLYTKLGMKMQLNVKRGVETYKGIPIDAMTFTVQPVDANSPQAQTIKSIYGEGVNLRLAVVNNLLVYAMTPEPEKVIHTLIDQAMAGGPSQVPTEVQAALALMPEAKKSQLFGTFNILRALQMAMTMMPIPAPPAEVATQSNVAFAGQIGGGRLRLETAVPKQHVLEVMAVVVKMQQEQQKAQQQQQREETPQAQPQGQPPVKPQRRQF